MDTTNRSDRLFSDDSVDAHLRALDPPAEWEPATGIALARFHERVAAAAPVSRRRWLWLLAAVPACLLILLLPPTRAVAQRMWDILWVGGMTVVTMDVDKLPESLTAVRVNGNGFTGQVATPAAAAARARFEPRLPDPAVLADRPALSVVEPMSFMATVKAADLQAALEREGVSDRTIPTEWDGARIVVHTSALVTADYPDVQVMQMLPLAITTPPGFDFAAFTETVLRIAGLTPSDARAYAARMVQAPVWIFPIAPDEEPLVRMRQVRLRAGQGTLLHDYREDGSFERATLVWSVPDRIYVISASASDDRVIDIADSIP